MEKRRDSSHNTIFNDGVERMRLFKEASEVSPAGSIPSSIQVITHFISGLYSTEVPVPPTMESVRAGKKERIM